jgi:hypothetical protein
MAHFEVNIKVTVRKDQAKSLKVPVRIFHGRGWNRQYSEYKGNELMFNLSL